MHTIINTFIVDFSFAGLAEEPRSLLGAVIRFESATFDVEVGADAGRVRCFGLVLLKY